MMRFHRMHRIFEFFEFQATVWEIVLYTEDTVFDAAYVKFTILNKNSVHSEPKSFVHFPNHCSLQHLNWAQLSGPDQNISWFADESEHRSMRVRLKVAAFPKGLLFTMRCNCLRETITTSSSGLARVWSFDCLFASTLWFAVLKWIGRSILLWNCL